MTGVIGFFAMREFATPLPPITNAAIIIERFTVLTPLFHKEVKDHRKHKPTDENADTDRYEMVTFHCCFLSKTVHFPGMQTTRLQVQ